MLCRLSHEPLVAAIRSHDLEFAASLLTIRFKATYRIVVEIGAPGGRTDSVIMRVRGDEVRFQLSPELLVAPGGELNRWVVSFALFAAFMASPHRVDGDFVINLGDRGVLPGLAFSECDPGYYLIPDPAYVGQDRYNQARLDFRTNDVAWDDRAPIAFWRGSSTGLLRAKRNGPRLFT
jgi:hypothetical protein